MEHTARRKKLLGLQRTGLRHVGLAPSQEQYLKLAHLNHDDNGCGDDIGGLSGDYYGCVMVIAEVGLPWVRSVTNFFFITSAYEAGCPVHSRRLSVRPK